MDTPQSQREAALIESARKYVARSWRGDRSERDIVVKSARGSKLLDFSGNEYIDYLLGSGPMLLGHAHPAVVAAVRDYLDRGSTYYLANEPAIRLAQEVSAAVPCAEKVIFCSTGSEATLYALRLARAYRKRDKILKFEGGFHGIHDYALMSSHLSRRVQDFPAPIPESAGIPRCIVEEVLVAPFNDIETTATILKKHREELGAVIVEPLQRTTPPQKGFLEGLRQLTNEHHIPLIFDEVATGFRLAYGGAQEYYGVVPDLCTQGKVLGGGFPISAICGNSEIMALLDPGQGEEQVLISGTLAGNPISATAALATLKELRQEGTYERLFAMGKRLMEALRRLLAEAEIPAQVVGEPPAFEAFFTEVNITNHRSLLSADTEMRDRFMHLLLDRGILKGKTKFYVSLAHTEEDIEKTIDAFGSAIDELRDRRNK